jgi:3,4-dihydroxy 2-butanone 4-phosphate synthase/GTP cyclohydrolase II
MLVKTNNKKIEKNIVRILKIKFPTIFGKFKLILFKDVLTNNFHIAITKGILKNKENVLVRVHSSCETGDIFHSLRCDCGEQLEIALKKIEENNCGIVLYMHQEGRGIGLINKLKAYKLQENGIDTVDANIALGFKPDNRNYEIAAKILLSFNLKSICIITNNPNKIFDLKKYGVNILKRVPIEVTPNIHNIKYLKTKKYKMKHILKSVQ